MFEFLFKYPPAIFSKGKFVLLSPWPVWLLILLVLAAGGGLYWNMRQRHGILTSVRATSIWLAQTILLALNFAGCGAPERRPKRWGRTMRRNARTTRQTVEAIVCVS